MFRGLRFDHFLVMDSGRHPMPEAMRDEVWERYATAHERLRELADERAADPGDDVDLGDELRARQRRGARDVARAGRAPRVRAGGGRHRHHRAAHRQRGRLPQRPPRPARRGDRGPVALGGGSSRRRCAAAARRPSSSAHRTSTSRSRASRIPADEVVWLSLASASNDPAHYDEPERWDIHREKPDDHLAFGKGRHFCLGAPIGRAEARIGLRCSSSASRTCAPSRRCRWTSRRSRSFRCARRTAAGGVGD